MQFKRTDTFDLSGPVSINGPDGEAISDLTGWTGRSEIRTVRGRLIAELNFAWLDASQRLCRIWSDDTSNWDVGKAETDIQFTSPTGQRISTRKTEINIYSGVTVPEGS